MVLQGFRGKNAKFVPKEVSVADVEGFFISHWVLNAPYPYLDIATCWREMNNRQTINQHGLEWYDGDAEIPDVLHNVREICRNARRIFTEGVEEAGYLQILTAREVINLGTEDPYKKFITHRGPEKTVCYLHAMRNQMADRMYSCALRTALTMRRYLLQKQKDNRESGQYSENTTDDEVDVNQDIPPEKTITKGIFNIF